MLLSRPCGFSPLRRLLILNRPPLSSSPTFSRDGDGSVDGRAHGTETYHSDASTRPLRSVLYVPAANARALKKLGTLSGPARPDAVVFDLEDGVGPDRKGEAREKLMRFFDEKREGSSPNVNYFGMVRINGVDTPWFEDDASMAAELAMGEAPKVEGVVLPKIDGSKDVDSISQYFSGLCKGCHGLTPAAVDESSSVMSPVPFWAMMETPRAILSASEIAGHPSIQGLILGTNDLCKELRLRPMASSGTARGGLATSLQMTVLAGRAHGKPVIDGVYNNFRDEEGLRAECLLGKEWGMDGKSLIHPGQVPVTNEILAPSTEEIDYAKRVVACWDAAAMGEGSEDGKFTGVAVLEGVMIEKLHLEGARRLLEQARWIQSTN